MLPCVMDMERGTVLEGKDEHDEFMEMLALKYYPEFYASRE